MRHVKQGTRHWKNLLFVLALEGLPFLRSVYSLLYYETVSPQLGVTVQVSSASAGEVEVGK